MRAAISCHLYSILDQSKQLHRQLVDVQDVTEYHLHILQRDNMRQVAQRLERQVCDQRVASLNPSTSQESLL